MTCPSARCTSTTVRCRRSGGDGCSRRRSRRPCSSGCTPVRSATGSRASRAHRRARGRASSSPTATPSRRSTGSPSPSVDGVDASDVSVVICTRDRPDALVRALEALSAQCAPPGEIVVVDNAPSDDATRDVVASAPGVRYVLEPRPGLSVARNTGIRASRGGVIAFTDDDAEPHRAWTGQVARAMAHARRTAGDDRPGAARVARLRGGPLVRGRGQLRAGLRPPDVRACLVRVASGARPRRCGRSAPASTWPSGARSSGWSAASTSGSGPARPGAARTARSGTACSCEGTASSTSPRPSCSTTTVTTWPASAPSWRATPKATWPPSSSSTRSRGTSVSCDGRSSGSPSSTGSGWHAIATTRRCGPRSRAT